MRKIFVSGCFDILHGGHVQFLNQARSLGDHLTVSVVTEDYLRKHKSRQFPLPLDHKIALLRSLRCVDEVVVGQDDDRALDFKSHFLRIKPDILAVTEDDLFGQEKRALCAEVGAQYVVLPKELDYEKISTSEIIHNIRAPQSVPLRVDFAGAWLDVPKYSDPEGYIVNCAISPLVSLADWQYQIGGGLGGSAAYAELRGLDSVEFELNKGVGWQDPAIIRETGLCVWQSGVRPTLVVKYNPSWLEGRMAILWSGQSHVTENNTDKHRDYSAIKAASQIARFACEKKDIVRLMSAVQFSLQCQIDEGMEPIIPPRNCAVKYCGGGWGGYALYLFKNKTDRTKFVRDSGAIAIEPYLSDNSESHTS